MPDEIALRTVLNHRFIVFFAVAAIMIVKRQMTDRGWNDIRIERMKTMTAALILVLDDL